MKQHFAMRSRLFRLLSGLLLLAALFSLSACGAAEVPVLTGDDVPGSISEADGSFAIHFIDVGQADCILVCCDDEAMLVDGGNVEDSSTVVTYLKKQGIDHLDYIVCTHAHEDHVGGLSGALNYASVDVVYAPVMEYDTKAFKDFVKYTKAQGLEISDPPVGETVLLGDAVIEFVGPLYDYEETNDTSIVLRICYGDTSFLLTGDMEHTAEKDLVDAGVELQSDVLKVGHHGSAGSSSYVFLREVAPIYGVISVGADNSYGHPMEEALSRLRDAGVTLYRTDLQGDIICQSDGREITFFSSRNSNAVTNPTGNIQDVTADTVYIGNKNSHKFHKESCENLPAEENRVYFDDRTQAIDEGYSACGNCNP